MDALFWGKLDRKTCSQLPLEHHLADVAAVLECLCSQPVFRHRLAACFGRAVAESDIARLGCFAVLHDIGKLLVGFQNHATGASPRYGHIFPIPGLLTPQNLLRFAECFPELPEWSDVGETVRQFLLATFSHHGTPIPDKPDIDRQHLWPQDGNAPEWLFLQHLCRLLKKWFPAAFADDAPSLPETPLLQHYFAGLLMLSDWLGSDTRFFPISRDHDMEIMEFARQQAYMALDTVGLSDKKYNGNGEPPSFKDQFDFAPNALQQAIDDIPLQMAGGITIVEAETGVGKTEAALRFFTRLFHAGLVDGLYFANPLRFAATQLFGRVSRFAESTFKAAPLATILAVPGYLRVDDASGTRLPDYSVLWDDNPASQEAARRWAGEHPKRYLAAPLSVGTIDQALLAGLKTPHAHLRAAALSRSLLIIDEVHASDPYMTRLTLAVIDLFRRLGGQVLLLSATLGGETRRKYLRAMGAVLRPPTHKECAETPYPLISTPKHTLPVAETRAAAGKKPPVRCTLHPDQDDAEALAKRIAGYADTILNGGRILVLRNSVRSAVETLQALEEVLPTQSLHHLGDVVCPHHSRYARVDRERLDRSVEAAFGKNGASRGGILVSTQTLEQSLDVDFDLLITDLCPMDVLLQRIGRLHRHRKRDANRPPELREPRCMVLTPASRNADALRTKEAKSHQYGAERAYPNLPALMATWEKLERLGQADLSLRIPEMCRELVEDALHSERLEAVAAQYGMQAELTAVMGAHGAMATLAHQMILRWDEPFSEQTWAREDPRAQTRLGTADLALCFDTPFPSPFGGEIDALVLPEHMLPRSGCDEQPEVLQRTPERTLFRVGSQRYEYTRYGLSKEPLK